MELHGAEASPFQGLILDGLSEEDANFFRDLHIQLRISYRTYEEARILASRLASSEGVGVRARASPAARSSAPSNRPREAAMENWENFSSCGRKSMPDPP